LGKNCTRIIAWIKLIITVKFTKVEDQTLAMKENISVVRKCTGKISGIK
jgi:hypothetical protein